MKTLKDHFQILIIMTVINLFVLWNFISNEQVLHGIGYFIFFYVAVFSIYYFTKRIPPKTEIEIKSPKKELIIVTLFALLGLLFLQGNFLLRSDVIPSNPMYRIPILLGNLLFSMPIAILIYLLIKRYKIMQLGLNTKPIVYLFLGVVIWGMTGFFAYLFNESGIIWTRGLEELGGFGNLIIQGVIGAALAEEFSRFIIQSRFEKLIKTNGLNILFATIIWAFMHFPVSYYQNEDAASTVFYCIQIIPIGFVWGYLTQMTKSILPSVIAHGFNLWGFQNG